MKKQTLKKFLRKNRTLQERLENFLMWRKNERTSKNEGLKEQALKNFKSKNPTFQKFLDNPTLKKKFLKKASSSSGSKIYKPIKLNLKPSWLQRLQKANLEPTFFPQKKPFMQFWVFPLLGACFLSTFQDSANPKNAKSAPPLFSVIKDKGLNLAEDFSSLPFEGNYGPVYSQTNSQAQELENLCEFYLNLTKQELAKTHKNSAENPFYKNETFFEKHLLTSMALKKAAFNWRWYSLNTNFLQGSALTPNPLEQKLDPQVPFDFMMPKDPYSRTRESVLLTNPSQNAKNDTLTQTFKNPILSYNQGGKIFDQWMNSTILFDETSSQTVKTVDKEASLDLLDKIYQYENYFKKVAPSASQSEKALFQFAKFLEDLEAIETQLKKDTLTSPTKNLVQSSENLVKAKFFKILLKKSLKEIQEKTSFKSQTGVVGLESQKPWIQNKSGQNRFKKILTTTCFTHSSLKTKALSFRKAQKDPGNFSNMEMLDLLYLKNLKENFNHKKSTQRVPFETRFQNPAMEDSTKFVQEIHLYKKLNKIGKKISHFPVLESKEKKSLNSVFPYQTPILMTSLSGNPYLSDSKSGLANSLVNKSSSLNAFEETTVEKSFISNAPVFSNRNSPVPNTEKIESSTELIREFKKAFERLLTRPSFSNDWEKPSSWFKSGSNFTPKPLFVGSLSEFQENKMKRFSISKKWETKDQQSIYFLNKLPKVFDAENSDKNPATLRGFKRKPSYSISKSLTPTKHRKFEKIFRAQFSVKNLRSKSLKESQNLVNETLQAEKFTKRYSFLTKLKKRLKTQNFGKSKHLKAQYLFTEIAQERNPAFRHSKWLQDPKGLEFQKVSTKGSVGSKNANNIQVRSMVPTFSLNQLESFHFLKSADFLSYSSDHLNFERKKSLQKKRRLKKLKLENRRRKKRKRFYPRPHSLRFQLYFNFLTKRHSSKLAKNVKSNVLEIQDFHEFKLKEKIYGQNPESNLFEKLLFQMKPVSHEKEFYKISNQTLTDFERLCWKSYWLRANLKPYIYRLQENLKRMQQAERAKGSDPFVSKLFQNLTYPIQSKLNLDRIEATKTDSVPYMNLTAFEKFGEQHYSSLFSNEFRKSVEYEKILYERVLHEIQNVKNQLNVNGQTQPRSYKLGRSKLEKPREKRLFNSLVALNNNYFNPQVKASWFDSFLGYSSVPSFGELPTLRVLWAFNKTQLFTYKQNNFSKQIWTLYKQREQTKNNKTRKFFLKFSPFKTKTLESLSNDKTKMSFKKIQLFGGRVLGAYSPTYLRQLKFNLQGYNRPSNNMKDEDFAETKQTSLWFETNLQNKLQKRRIHFWWLGGKQTFTETEVPFFMVSPMMLNELGEMATTPTNPILGPWNTNLKNSNPTNLILMTSFCVACCFVHLAIFFSVIRIPEIRSLLKFQFLILSKMTNLYLTGLYSIYDVFKRYKKQLKILFNQVETLHTSQIAELRNQQKELKASFRSVTKNDRTPVSYFEQKKGNVQHQNSFLSFGDKNSQLKSNIRYTLNLDFQYRDLFDLLKIQSQKALGKVPMNQMDRIYDILKTSLSPSFMSVDGHNSKSQKKTLSFFSSSPSSTGFWWFSFSKNLNRQDFLKKKEGYLKEFLNAEKPNLRTRAEGKSGLNTEISVQSDFQIQYILSLVFLSLTKLTLTVFYQTLQLLYQLILKGVDFLESILLLFYKFLEKPAELMVDWIADLFLVEWSSDVTTYVPEAFDRSLSVSFKKWSRGTRVFGQLPFGFLMQRLLFTTTESFYQWILKPDADLMARQKKGVIFWDIWGEILIQAAEKYKMNLSSLNTVKEEQELLIENLLEEKSGQSDSKTQKTENVHSPNFLSSSEFKKAIHKLKPLTKFLQDFPPAPSTRDDNSVNEGEYGLSLFKNRVNERHVLKTLQTNLQFSDPFFVEKWKKEGSLSLEEIQSNQAIDPSKRWSVSQFLTTQGRDTDLFMDIHPPKSFTHLRFLKNYLPAQEVLGSLVCEIYGGLFPTKISKNILIVGSPGSSKSFFIQALAGETELKIVTDNAHRYCFVNNGIPVGMKLLREVFDSLALHTPCLFVLEDIHIIGERRPMLMSDDEISKTKDFTFGADQDEVHEKNRLLYQFSRHSISHYKKPYKADFSSSSATNQFSYDLFLGVQPPRKRKSNLTVKPPLPLTMIERNLSGQDMHIANAAEQKTSNQKRTLLSSLQISMEQVFAPPATSPFHILLMKEQKKLRPKKVVKEMPWSGLSYDQMMLLSKSHYSVRVKVALLAESAMVNLSMKLDMITDLLVIIDSVRSNRGFVVFGTTHVPSLLDPALRRPGRFDETLALPVLPNLSTRFEILKTALGSYTRTTDFLDLSLFTSNQKQTESEILDNINKVRLLLFNSHNSPSFNFHSNLFESRIFSNFYNDYSIYSIEQAFQTTIQQSSLLLNLKQWQKVVNKKRQTQNLNGQGNPAVKVKTLKRLLKTSQKATSLMFNGHDSLNYVSLSYAQAGQFLVEALLLKTQKAYGAKFLMSSSLPAEISNNEESLYQILYGSKVESENLLLKLFAGKISEFFILNSNVPMQKAISKDLSQELGTNPSKFAAFENQENFQNYWQSAISFLQSLEQKRYLYSKNQIVSKMLFVEDQRILREPPSPPNSTILMPSKKFENYKRTLKDFIQKPMLTINEKLQMHQKQRFLKLLYNIPVQQSFEAVGQSSQSSKNSRQLTNFYQSFKELSYLDLLTAKPTSSYAFYKNRFLTRHCFSFLNQWWNGQLAEHNVETTYLSHVDWRSMFVQSLGDLTIDFPDADQYYNPRKRRWYLHSDSWSYWADFEKNLDKEITEHRILNCFTKTSNLLNSNRELFDYLSYRFLRDHQLKEIDFIDGLVRFYKNDAN